MRRGAAPILIFSLCACESSPDDIPAPDATVDAGAEVAADAAEAPDMGVRTEGPDAAVFEVGSADLGAADAGAQPILRFALSTDPARPLEIIAVAEADQPFELELRVDGPGVRDRRLVADGPRARHEEAVLALRERSTYRVRALARMTTGELLESVESATTGELPAGTMAFTLRRGLAPVLDDRVVLFGQRTTRSLEFFGLDREGQVVWHYADAVSPGVLPSITPLPGRRFALVIGQEVRVIDARGRTVRTYRAPTKFTLHHDAFVAEDDHLFFLAYDRRMVDIPALGGLTPIMGDTIVELSPSGEVVRETHLLDILDPTRFPGELSMGFVDVYRDWSHSNSVWHDPVDDSLLVSVRHQNWIVKIDRTTGHLVWRFGQGGDFTLTGGSWFTSSHSAKPLGRGALTLYDNGNERATPRSRAVRYAIDEAQRVAQEDWAWWTPFYTAIVGDADDHMDGTWLVTTGSGGEGTPATVFEVETSGVIRWSFQSPFPVIYRGERVDATALR